MSAGQTLVASSLTCGLANQSTITVYLTPILEQMDTMNARRPLYIGTLSLAVPRASHSFRHRTWIPTRTASSPSHLHLLHNVLLPTRNSDNLLSTFPFLGQNYMTGTWSTRRSIRYSSTETSRMPSASSTGRRLFGLFTELDATYRRYRRSKRMSRSTL